MEDILQQQEATSLHTHAHQIQAVLFDEQSEHGAFNAQALLKLVSELRGDKRKTSKQRYREERYALPPLYHT